MCTSKDLNADSEMSLFEKVQKVQGPSYTLVFLELALTDRNMQVRFFLKVVLKFWDLRNFAVKNGFYEMHAVRHLRSKRYLQIGL